MSELSVGQLKGLLVNNNKIIVPSGHTLYAPGHVIQTVSASSTTSTTLTATSYTQVGGSALSLTITPKSISSGIYIQANIGFYSPSQVNGYMSIYRNNSVNVAEAGYYGYQAGEFNYGAFSVVDYPATTSPVTYNIYAKNGNTVTWYVNYVDGGGQVRSTITAMEIAA